MAETQRKSAIAWMLGPLAPRPRLTASVVVALVVGAGLAFFAPDMPISTRLILAWDALAVTFLVAMFTTMLEHSPTDIRAQAAIDDEGRGAILGLVLLASAASVWAVAVELSMAKDGHSALTETAHIMLAFFSVIVSWLMVQMIFTLHYAHEYYGVDEDDGDADAGGLDFPGVQLPDYWDFLHFAIVIGVACATADVDFTSQGLRRLGTLHSLVAFAFNTVIVALTINLAAGLF